MYNEDKDDSEHTYRLRWEGGFNIIDFNGFFSSLRKNEELFDVTLGCSTNDGEITSLKAHMMILAAYSDVFKDMFLQLNNKKEPYIFMRGLSDENLHHLLNFI